MRRRRNLLDSFLIDRNPPTRRLENLRTRQREAAHRDAMHRAEHDDPPHDAARRGDFVISACGYRAGIDVTGVRHDKRLRKAQARREVLYAAEKIVELGDESARISRIERAGYGGGTDGSHRTYLGLRSVLVKQFQYPFQGVDNGLFANAFAVTCEPPRLGMPPAFLALPRKAHRAYRLGRTAAAWSGDPGHRDRQAAFASPQRARCHFTRGLLAHRAAPGERIGAHAEQLALGVVGVGDEPALEPVGRARDRGDGLSNPAAGARFRRDQHLARRLEPLADPCRELSHQKNSRFITASTISA